MSETGAGRPGGSGQGDPEDPVAREAVLARAFVRLADTLASDFDIVDFLHGLSADSVEREGFPRMRAVGEMSWALRKTFPGSEDLFAYEAEVNRFVGSYQVLYFCLYDVDTASGSMVMDAIKTHPQVLIGGCLFENPYYMEPEHFLGRAACVN